MSALASLYDSWVAQMSARPDMPLEEIRGLFDQWSDVTAEPEGVEYVEGAASGIPALWAVPAGAVPDRVLLCFHGGGYALGSIHSHRKLYGHFARAFGCRALIIDYRRAPEHVFPAQVEDTVLAYRWLIEGQGFAPEHVLLVGDSAGGALCISTLLLVRDRGLPLPAGAIPMAPYLDTEAKGGSYVSNAELDRLGSREATLAFIPVFLGPEGDPHDPLANPLHADLSGLPPMLIQVGGHDVLLDDSRAFFEKAKAAGLDVALQVDPDMQHVYQFEAGNCPVADAAIRRAAEWGRKRLGLAAS
ncbi:alpha/beta hydrolase [Tsuneonella sp. CC-YZS046]|uniref:alpha/beta hydrolase n=1 Tax=Tsuneonella sp. CC-YZS046 TaxID=3042152 RepID=UPI002D7736D2|nr:alpha/beta hydrolase [Tsuneonella sp. CC-YZS046]WRO66439.1 alpha/beta hydrolase [Tsuneonella sp. CC-YZS046]